MTEATEQKVESRECARCPRPLGPANRNEDKLCGYCQAELHLGSPKHKAWVTAGRKRVIQARCERCPSPKIVKDRLCEGCLAARERGKKGARVRLAKRNGHALDAIQALSQDPAMKELRELVRKYGITKLAMTDETVVMTRSYTAKGAL